MSNAIVTAYMATGRRNPGASLKAITDLNQAVGRELPVWYTSLLEDTNGIEGVVGDGDYLALWTAEEVVPLNDGYEVKEFVPGLLLIGTNGGGVGFGLDLRQPRMSLIEVDLVGMSWETAISLGEGLESLLNRCETRLRG